MRLITTIIICALIAIIIGLQLFLTDIGRRYPTLIGHIAFTKAGAFAFHHEYDRGKVYPIKIGMLKREVREAFKVNEPEFTKLRGIIFHESGEREFTENYEHYTARKNGLRVQYTIKYEEDKIINIEITSRLFSL